jgi:periplasmic protein TonB
MEPLRLSARSGSGAQVIRLTSAGATLATLGASATLHAAVLLLPMGHAGTAPGPGDQVAAIEVSIEPSESSPPVPVPETVATPAGRAVPWPTHTHPYPVPVDHDAVPHDPHLEHRPVPAAPGAPAEAVAAESTRDNVPRFTIAIGTAGDAHGVVAPRGATPPPEATVEPLPGAVVDGKALLVSGLAPAYPDDARGDGIEGDVRLELIVGVSGLVESARVVQGVGHGLDDAALRAIRQFRFAPATKDGRAVRVRMGWSMQFRLH